MVTHRRLLILLLLASIAAVQLIAFAGYQSPPSTNNTSFIRKSCATTRYPDLCYTSLSRFSKAVKQDPGRLARVAVCVTLSEAKRMANHVSKLSRQADKDGSDPSAAAAVHDCHSAFTNAVDEIHGSLKQMTRLRGSGQSLRFQLSNVQTWMSAALTNEETCTDGFEDVPEGKIKSDVCDRAGEVKELTSNALALVNSYVNKKKNNSNLF